MNTLKIHHDDLIRLPNGTAVIDFTACTTGWWHSEDVEDEVHRELSYNDDDEPIVESRVNACRVTRYLMLTLMPDRRLGIVYKLDTERLNAGYYFTVLGLRTDTGSFLITVHHNYVSDDALELQYLTNQQKP